MSRSWKGGSTRAWRKLRERVLEENRLTNGGRCTLAIVGVCTIWANTVHHVKGKAATGDDPRWLAAVCKACNLHIGEPPLSAPEPRRVSRW